MHLPREFLLGVLLTAAASTATAPVALAQQTPPAGAAAQPPAEGAAGASATARRGPRPYAQVIPARAHTERGGITVHRVDDRYFFEVPDSLVGRDFLMVTRVAGVPAGAGGFQSAGSSLNERLIRWDRVNDRVLLKSVSAVSPSTPLTLSTRPTVVTTPTWTAPATRTT